MARSVTETSCIVMNFFGGGEREIIEKNCEKFGNI
jgi:hypothetical protein